ncbi:MAG: phytochelatin synthase [Deltaproteobacteria bacterium]|nr:phytochelatin synthase [Deltaproteobacteria bacterium]
MYALEHGLGGSAGSLLDLAFEQPVAQLYKRSGLLSQKATALCGPTSLAMVLQSIGVEAEPGNVLIGTPVSHVLGVRVGGMSLDQLGEVLEVKTTHRTDLVRDLSLDALRIELRNVNDPRFRYIANFDRRPLFGWGGGHHSPLGAYLEAQDALLVLDVNSRVGPFMVSVPQFHRVLFSRDAWMDKTRGLARVTLG